MADQQGVPLERLHRVVNAILAFVLWTCAILSVLTALYTLGYERTEDVCVLATRVLNAIVWVCVVATMRTTIKDRVCRVMFGDILYTVMGVAYDYISRCGGASTGSHVKPHVLIVQIAVVVLWK